MESRKDITSSNHQSILELSSLFQNDFSSNWIAEILNIKPSLVLEALSMAVADGIITPKGSNFFSFSDPKSPKSYQTWLPFEKKELFHKMIVNILMRDLPDGDHKHQAISAHLLHIKCNLHECHLLMTAGDSFLKEYNMDNARLCFKKVLSNLSDSSRPDEDHLFIRAAIRFSKSSTAGNNTPEVLQILKDAKERAYRLDNQFL